MPIEDRHDTAPNPNPAAKTITLGGVHEAHVCQTFPCHAPIGTSVDENATACRVNHVRHCGLCAGSQSSGARPILGSSSAANRPWPFRHATFRARCSAAVSESTTACVSGLRCG